MAKVEDNQDNAAICVKYCAPCLSYPGVDGEELFCARGKSSAPKSKKGCNCGICDIQKVCGNRGAYYCISGAAE